MLRLKFNVNKWGPWSATLTTRFTPSSLFSYYVPNEKKQLEQQQKNPNIIASTLCVKKLDIVWNISIIQGIKRCDTTL